MSTTRSKSDKAEVTEQYKCAVESQNKSKSNLKGSAPLPTFTPVGTLKTTPRHVHFPDDSIIEEKYNTVLESPESDSDGLEGATPSKSEVNGSKSAMSQQNVCLLP